MTDRYERIRAALAMGPTPGPWLFCPTNSGTFVKSERLAGYFVEVRHCRTAQDVNADAHLIAACDPDTIRELLAECDALSAEVEQLRAEVERLKSMTVVTMGVGSGDGNLFVHGDWESIKAAQAIVLERGALAAEVERLREALKDADNELDWLDEDMGARLPTWQDMLSDAEQFVRQKPAFSKYRGTVLENDVPVWIADFAKRMLLRQRDEEGERK